LDKQAVLDANSMKALKTKLSISRPPQTLLQRKQAHGRDVRQGIVPSIVHDVLSSSGQPLDATTRAVMEPRFGHDFSQVRIHTDTQAAESARAVNALAYTVGRNVVFGARQYAPTTSEGRKLIAHELAHVLQQASVSGNSRPATVSLLDDARYERAAEAASDMATRQGIQPSPGAAVGLQRQPAANGKTQTDTCSGWENDPQSFSIRAARHFVATQVNPAWANGPVSVTCHNDHDCIVTFRSDLVIDVTWVKSTRRVGTGRNTAQGRQFCAYSYSCDAQGQLTLSVIKCYGTPRP
jgi:hypothetical protein